MVVAMMAACDYPKPRLATSPIVDKLLDGPTETARPVGVYGLEYEEDGTEFEKDDGAYEGGYATGPVDFAVELGRGSHERKPDEETLSNALDHNAQTPQAACPSAFYTYI
jgi:hypothetical protein